MSLPTRSGDSKLFCKGPENKNFQIYSPHGLCSHNAKAVIDSTQVNGYSCVLVKLYLKKEAVGQVWLKVAKP